jgi:FAD/FMN-containing dehydrogenase/Fe-S oxidoreductase
MTTYPPDLAEQFRKEIEGEVRFDTYSKILYSTDASVWQMEPIGAVIPKHAEDVAAAGRVAARNKVPILPRGGATSLSGQTVGHAVHIDFAKYMNQVLELNTEEHWVRIQPGVVQDYLNNYLRPKGFQLGPDTSSSSRATLGGMMGNNSAGSHSILHGKTIDHVIEIKTVLSDGSEAVFGPVTNGRLESLSRGDTLESRLYRELLALGESHKDEILRCFPKLMRRVSGYNLDELVRNRDCYGAGYSSRVGPLNLAKVIVGSEGTLALVSEAKIRIVPLPKKKALLLVHFRSLEEAVEATEEILTMQPAAAELIDEFILQSAFSKPDFQERMRFIDPQANAVMVVEFYGESENELRAKLDELQAKLSRNHMGFGYMPVTDPTGQQNIWKVRKESLGLLMSVLGDKKPIAFVEDPAVPVEKLPAFLRGFKEILARHDAHGGYYGHASVGCLHVRPMINLKEASEVRKMAEISDEVFALVKQYGGSMSGEHGDGIARGKYNQWLFGPKIYQAFKQLKGIFDPHNIMNPGKVVDCPEPVENLRWGAEYKTIEIKTHLDFSREGGFARAIEMCNGMGVCRKQDIGTMCPSYQATLEEEHSTRGRANALRAALSGRLPASEFTSKRMYDVLDLCLECKGCKRECPSNVDLAKIKYEFLAHYYEEHGTPLRARLFANIAKLNRWGSRFPSLANATMRLSPVKWLLDRFAGIDARRTMPPFAAEDFEAWFRRRRSQAPATGGQKVVLFHDCFMTYNYPEVGRAAVELLERAGFEIVLASKKCCGRPMISKGLIEDARSVAQHNVRVLEPYVSQGIPVLGCEPSCLLTLRDEYLDLVDSDASRKVASNAWMVDEFLVQQQKAGKLRLPFKDEARKVLFHGHCHQKAHIGSGPSLEALRLAPGISVSEVNSGCCGMAGSFGFEKEHYDISETIGRQRLMPAVEQAGLETEIAVTGVSCRQQISHFTQRKPRHVVEVLRDALVD